MAVGQIEFDRNVMIVSSKNVDNDLEQFDKIYVPQLKQYLPVLEVMSKDKEYYIIKFEEINDSYQILIPILFNSAFDYSKNRLVNIFTGINEPDPFHIYLKYLKCHSKEVEPKLINHSQFVENIDFDTYILYKFKVSEKWIPDYSLLLDGKYSELSKTGKGIILGYFDKEFGKPLRLGMEQIFNRDRKLKKEWEAKIGMELPPNAELHTKLSLDVLNLDCALI